MSETHESAAPQRVTRGLVGFYTACTVFGLAVTITAVAWIVFPDIEGMATAGWVGLGLAAAAAFGTYHFLGVTRRER